MKTISKCIFLVCSVLMLVSCQYKSGLTFKGESENWSSELITMYSFFGEETQSIRITYKGNKYEQLDVPSLNVESTDFLGWGIGEIVLDKKGVYYSGNVIKMHTKTPSSSTIIVTLEGEEAETIELSLSS